MADHPPPGPNPGTPAPSTAPDRASTTGQPYRPSAQGLLQRSLATPLIVISLAALAAGVAWPQAADVVLRILVSSLVVGFVVGQAYRLVEPVLLRGRRYSPFGRPLIEPTPHVAPRALRKLSAELRTADDPRRAQRVGIPAPATLIVRQEAARRLAEYHGLNLRDPTHHARIRSLVSEPTWHLIRPHAPPIDTGGRPPARAPVVPLSELGRILDDLEAL